MTYKDYTTENDLIRKDFLLDDFINDNYGGENMQISKSVGFVKASDVKDLGLKKFKIVTEAKEQSGNFGMELVCQIKAINDKGQKDDASWRINNTTRNVLIDAWGKDTSDWIGKEVSIKVVSINNKDSIIAEPGQF